MKTYVFSILFLLVFQCSNAQVDTVYQLNYKQIKKYLKPSHNQYLVFVQRNDNPSNTMTWIWSREVRIYEKTERIEIEQKWYASDSTKYRYVFSQVRSNDFSPVYHYSKMNNKIEAFNFHENYVIGADSIVNNEKANFKLNVEKPFLNWELDMEIFPLLELKAGKHFAINFYHPGGVRAPRLYEYKVIGEESVKTLDGNVECWKLRIDHSEKYWAIFYISKKSREVLKMEEDFGIGKRYKVKLSNYILIK